MTTSIPIIHLQEVDSTQSFLARHPELWPCAVLADTQNAGRGRGGNCWESLPGAGLWLSAALPLQALPPGLLLQRAMMAVVEALETTGIRLGIKWPNDLCGGPPASFACDVPPKPPAPCAGEACLNARDLCGGPTQSFACDVPPKAAEIRRLVKLGGIIGEIKGNTMILGLGVNLRQAPHIPGRAIPPACLADFHITEIPAPLDLARTILELWQDLSVLRPPAFYWPEAGDAIAWEEGSGRCTGWLEDGRLGVETSEGPQALSSGDVTALRSKG